MLVPKLRFKRDDGTDYSEWSNKRFANAFTPLNNNTFSRDMLSENGTVLNIHYGDILVRFGEVCDIQTMDIPKVNTDIDTSRFDELQNGDIVLADTAEDETVGKAIEIYHIGTSKVVSGLHTMACRPTDKYAPKYMGYYINSPTYHNQLLPFMQGIKVTSIGRRNIADTVVYYPYDIEEQQKIAGFLSTVDEVITQSEAEVRNLEQQKKSAMQKIFSQELRFKREDGTEYPKWELIAFGNLYQRNNERNGNQFKTEKTISVATMKYNKKGNGADKNSLSTYKVLRLGDIAFEGHENKEFSHGRFVLNDIGDGIMSPRFSCLRPVKELVNGFWKYYIHYEPVMYSILLRSTKKGTMMHELVYDDFYKQSILVPKVEEQQKIADFLSALDEAINYAKQELDKWKELKKGLLQQMFV